MTNHPRRAGRRKYQRQFDRGLDRAGFDRAARAARSTTDAWYDLTNAIRSVRIGNGPEFVPDRIEFAPISRMGRGA